MAKSDNTTQNIVLGVLLGPLVGGYYGYRYAKLKQELYTLDPNAERGWDSAFTNILVGTLAGNIAAPLFGYNVARVEMKIEDLKDHIRQNNGIRRNGNLNGPGTYSQDLSNTRWRDQVSSEQLASAEITR